MNEHRPELADRFREGGSYEEVAGYSRAARRATTICVSGTTALGAAARGDTYAQSCDALGRAIAAVEHLGGRREDVVRTRCFLAPGADFAAAGRAHAELLGDVAPANTTLYVHALIGEGLLVEVELDAVVPG